MVGKIKIKLTDGGIYDGGNVYAFNSNGMFTPAEVSGDMVRVTEDSQDVINCGIQGTLWIVLSDDKPIFFRKFTSSTQYVCATTQSIDTFNRWCSFARK